MSANMHQSYTMNNLMVWCNVEIDTCFYTVLQVDVVLTVNVIEMYNLLNGAEVRIFHGLTQRVVHICLPGGIIIYQFRCSFHSESFHLSPF